MLHKLLAWWSFDGLFLPKFGSYVQAHSSKEPETQLFGRLIKRGCVHYFQFVKPFSLQCLPGMVIIIKSEPLEPGFF